ncbi:glutaredoxin family protein [Comamonas antarctica]|uniref:Glutaredoxin family protein n=1 Tax=Comamonas antarctica TaxID=2743470 RepID=A0A6N1X157_9BURK|nr:glutaredoxin family protein [Comamonas antarctica]QKV53031.1 glutaredoxin family protein [Comamonas antarctica]
MHLLSRSHRPALLLAAALILAPGLAHEAAAQLIYRSVGPDGRVTFSDRELNTARPPVVAGEARTPTAAANDSLPYALREVQARFPVTLYTGNDCSPCASARALLMQRGVPFTEFSVRSTADAQALQALSGQDRLPFATIGQQHVTGFAADEWRQYLDAAGYPQTSVLPASYRQPAARTLAPQAPPVASDPSQAGNPAAAARGRTFEAPVIPPNRVTPSNPAGLTF